MPVQYRIDVLAALKAAGYSTYKLRREKLLGESVIQQIRNGVLVSWPNVGRLCCLLNCQPGDLLEYIPDITNTAEQEDIPNAETLAAMQEADEMIRNGTGEHFTGETSDFLVSILNEPQEDTE
jgi:putative transcriptional regulator